MWVQQVSSVDGMAIGPVMKYNMSMGSRYEQTQMVDGRYGTYLIGYPRPNFGDAMAAFAGSRSMPKPEIWRVMRSMAGGGIKKWKVNSNGRIARRPSRPRSASRRRSVSNKRRSARSKRANRR